MQVKMHCKFDLQFRFQTIFKLFVCSCDYLFPKRTQIFLPKVEYTFEGQQRVDLESLGREKKGVYGVQSELEIARLRAL